MPTRLAKGLKNRVIKRVFPALVFGMKLRAIGKRTRRADSYHFNRAIRRIGEGFEPFGQAICALAMQRINHYLRATSPRADSFVLNQGNGVAGLVLRVFERLLSSRWSNFPGTS